MDTLVKNWLIASVYLYLFTILGHFQIPITDTDIAYVINNIHFHIFALAFFIALILQMWRSLLPALNKYYGLFLALIFCVFIFGWMVLMPHFEPLFHLTVLLGILAIQIIQYHSYNAPLQKKQSPTNNEKSEDQKISKIWIFLGIFFSFVFLYNVYVNNRHDAVTYYKDAYPTLEEVQEMYNTPLASANIGTEVNASQHADYNYAGYAFSDYYIEDMYSSMSVKGQSTTFSNYRYYISLERSADQDFTKIETNSDDLKLYYRTFENYDDGYDTINESTPTHLETSIFAIYETDAIKVYLEGYLQDDFIVDESQLLKDMQRFFDHMRAFDTSTK